MNSVRILSGNDSQFISYNDASNENASTKESDAIADIEEKLGVKMPEFLLSAVWDGVHDI